jgi:tRNA nucleotidyltransferase (CCA-adding enzyme)
MDTAIGISDSDLDAGTKMVLDIIREKGKAWIVGGWIRDRILDIPELEDIDIATNLKPNEILEIFPNSIMIGEKFGTVIVRLEDDSNQYSQEWEVTTLRSEGRYSDGRRPDSVEFGDDIYADLSRRDFTINAMAIDDKWNIIDKYGGKEDLEENILISVGNAQNRLQEDGLRIMRAFRFIGLKDGRILHFDDELGNALIENLDMLDKVSRERIESEFRKILELDKRMEILSMMNKFGVLKKIFPSLEIDLDVELSDDYRVNLALISRNYVNEKIELSQILRGDLKISNKNMIMIQFLHNNGQRMPRIDKSELRRFRAYLS